MVDVLKTAAGIPDDTTDEEGAAAAAADNSASAIGQCCLHCTVVTWLTNMLRHTALFM